MTEMEVEFTRFPDSKIHGPNMGPIWGRQDPGAPHVGPINFSIWVWIKMQQHCTSDCVHVRVKAGEWWEFTEVTQIFSFRYIRVTFFVNSAITSLLLITLLTLFCVLFECVYFPHNWAIFNLLGKSIGPCLWTGAEHAKSKLLIIVSLVSLESQCVMTSLSISPQILLN